MCRCGLFGLNQHRAEFVREERIAHEKNAPKDGGFVTHNFHVTSEGRSTAKFVGLPEQLLTLGSTVARKPIYLKGCDRIFPHSLIVSQSIWQSSNILETEMTG
jgi:hypothetical protein